MDGVKQKEEEKEQGKRLNQSNDQKKNDRKRMMKVYGTTILL